MPRKTKKHRTYARRLRRSLSIFVPLGVLLASVALGDAARYEPSRCANHNPADMAALARDPIADSRTVCSAVPERLNFYQKAIFGGGERQSLDARIDAVSAGANAATAAYVAKAASIVDQQTSQTSVADLLAKMRAAKGDLDKISEELQAIGKSVLDDEKKIAAKHTILSSGNVRARNEIFQIAARISEIQQGIGLNEATKKQFNESIARFSADPNAQSLVYTQKRRLAQLQAVIDSQNQAKAGFEKQRLEAAKAIQQLANADKDVAKDYVAFGQVLRDWQNENRKLKIVASRISYADPQSTPAAREAAKSDLALARSSVLGPDGKPLTSSTATPAIPGVAAHSDSGHTSVEKDIAKLTAGSEAGDLYQGVFEKTRDDIESGKTDQKQFLGNSLAEKALLNDQQHEMDRVGDNAALLADDKKIDAVPANIRDAVGKAQVAYADLTKGDIMGERRPADPDASVMGSLIPSYQPKAEFQDRVNKDLKTYNDAMATLSPEEQAYAARLGVPSKLAQSDLAFTTMYSQHGADSVNTEASTTKGWYTWARDSVKGAAIEAYDGVTGNRVISVRDTGIFDSYRNNVAALGEEGQKSGFTQMVFKEQKQETYQATGDSSTYTFGEKVGNVYMPQFARAVLPESLAPAPTVIDEQVAQTVAADKHARETGLAEDVEYARDLRSSIVRQHFASTAEIVGNAPIEAIQLKNDTTIQNGLSHDDSDWRWGERKAFWRDMVLGSVGGPGGQALVAASDTSKADLLRVYANTYQTPELINAANRASATAESSRNGIAFAGAMTLTGQTIISGAVMRATKAAYYETTAAAMVVRETAASARVAETASRTVERVATRDVVKSDGGAGNLTRELHSSGAEYRASPVSENDFVSHAPTPTAADRGSNVVRELGRVDSGAAIVDRGSSATEHVAASTVNIDRVAAAPVERAVEDAGAPASRAFMGSDRSAPAAERGLSGTERMASTTIEKAPAESLKVNSGASAASAVTGRGAVGAVAPSSARSITEAATEGAQKIGAAIRDSVKASDKVAEPAATVSSSSFLARIADSVGLSGQKVATVTKDIGFVPSTELRQGERGVQELEHLASGAQAAARPADGASRLNSEGSSLARVADSAAQAPLDAAKGAVAPAAENSKGAEAAVVAAVSGDRAPAAVKVAGEGVERTSESKRDASVIADATQASETARPAAVAAEKPEISATTHSREAVPAAAKNVELASKEIVAAAKDELTGAKEAISPRTFAAEAEKMLKPGSRPDRYLDHITNLGAIKLAALKDPAYLEKLAKVEGATPASYLKKLDRRINYFEHQLHETYSFPKNYLEQFKEATLHGGFKPEDLAGVKRLLTQRAVLDSSVAKMAVASTAKGVEKAMKAVADGGDRAVLEAALRKSAVPEKLVSRVANAMEAAKKADRLSDPALRAAIPAVARDLAGAAVLTKKAPQVGHDLFENLVMAFNPSNHMALGLAQGAFQSYVSNPFVRAGTWMMERPDWFRGVPKYAVKDFTQMELEARLAEASLSSSEKLSADVLRMARVAEETETADQIAKTALEKQEAAAKAERDALNAEFPKDIVCGANDEIACSNRYMGGPPIMDAFSRRVDQLKPEDKLWEMAKNPATFSREAFFKESSEVVDLASYLESQGITKYPAYEKVNGALEKLGAPFRALLFDPGTIVHGEELADFIAKSKVTWKDPWELRRAFSAELGTQKVYRGLTLTPEMVEKIKVEGMLPSAMRDPGFKGFVTSMGFPIEAMAKIHIRGITRESMFQSITYYKDFAASIASKALKGAPPDAATYVVELEIPKLDLFYHNSSGYPTIPQYAQLYHELWGITRDGKPFSSLPGGPGLESLVYLPIPPSQIKGIEKVSDASRYDFVAPNVIALEKEKWRETPGPRSPGYMGNKITDADVAKLQAYPILAGAGDYTRDMAPAAVNSDRAFDLAEKIKVPMGDAAPIADAIKAEAPPAGSLLFQSRELASKMEGTVRSLLDSGYEADPVRRQFLVENSVRALVTEDRIPRAEVEKLRAIVSGGKIPKSTAKEVAERSNELAQARFLANPNIAPKVASLERNITAAMKVGDSSALRSLGIDDDRAEKFLNVEKLYPGLLAKQGATRNLAESLLLSRDSGLAFAKNRWLNASERLRRFAAGSAQLSSALVVGAAHGVWSGAKWAAGLADGDAAKNYWTYKLAGYGLNPAKDSAEVRWTAASLKQMNKQARAEEAQSTAYWMLVAAGEKTDAASRVAREAALGALHDSGLSPEAIALVRAEALLHTSDPLALAPVKNIYSLEDVLRKKDLEPAAGRVFTRTAGLNDPTSNAARAAAEKALLDSGWTREEVNGLLADAKVARKARDSEAKTAVRELIDLAQLPPEKATGAVNAVVESLRASGHGDAAIQGVREMIARDSKRLRDMLRGSPRESNEVVANALREQGIAKDYEALLMPIKFQTPEQERSAVAKLIERLDREPGIDHGSRASVSEKLARLEEQGVEVSTTGVHDSNGNRVWQAEGGVDRTEEGKIRLSTNESATQRGQLAAEAMLAHETVHVRSLQMAEKIEGLEGSLASASGSNRDSISRQLAEASGRSVFLKSVDGAPVILGSPYADGFALDEVQAHLEGARKETALARMYFTQSASREASLRASAGLGFAKESLGRAEEFSGAGRVHLGGARDLVKDSPAELVYDATSGKARVEVPYGAGKVAVEMTLARGLSHDVAATRFISAADITAQELAHGVEKSRSYLAQETARLRGRLDGGSFGKLGGGAYANAKPTLVRGTAMYTPAALRNAEPAVREAALLRDAREAAQADLRRVALAKATRPSERLPLLAQEEDYLARRVALAKDELQALRNSETERRAAELERAHAGIAAQLLGDRIARERELARAGTPTTAKSFVGSLDSSIFAPYADQFPGLTFDQVLADPTTADLFKALHEHDIALEAKYARESREALAGVIGKDVSGAEEPSRADAMAGELAEAQAKAAGAPDAKGREKIVTEELGRKGWSEEQVSGCVAEGICAPKLEARAAGIVEAEASPLARQALVEAEVSRAAPKVAMEARAIAKLPEHEVSLKDLQSQAKSLAQEASAKANALGAKPDNVILASAFDEVKRAETSVNIRIDSLAAAPKKKTEIPAKLAVKTKADLLAAQKAARSEKVSLEAQTKALIASEVRKASGRKTASVASENVSVLAGRELEKIAGLDDRTRTGLAKSIAAFEVDAKTADARIAHMRALSLNPDLFETYRMAYLSASSAFREAGAKGEVISREKAWDAGVRQMLLDSGYTKPEIEAGLLRKTEACLTM